MRLFWLIFLPALAYQLLAIAASLLHLGKRRAAKNRPSAFRPGVSVLKPLYGLDPGMHTAFASQARQNYPQFEILFGVRRADDPAAAEVHRLMREFPLAPIRLIIGSREGANRKVGVLAELARHARYAVWVVNDSDITVTADYLAETVTPLADRHIGIVTCLYRPRAHSLPAWFEALGIATDFMPSTLVAPLVGVREFGLGSTLVFRAADLKKAGGFPSICDYLADDYHLAKQITALGKRALLSTYTVETTLSDSTWTGVWQHQLRWARTIRTSKPAGYAGVPITHAGLWASAAFLFGAWPAAFALLALRVISAAIAAGLVLQSAPLAAAAPLAPVWDLFAFAIWLSSYASRKVRWRDRAITVDRKGRICD